MCEAMNQLIKRGEEHGKELAEKKMLKLIKCMSDDGALESIPRIAAEPSFYREMLKNMRLQCSLTRESKPPRCVEALHM